MIRMCNVCSLRAKFNVDVSFREIGKLYSMKFKRVYSHRHRKNKEQLQRIHESIFENSRLMREILIV